MQKISDEQIENIRERVSRGFNSVETAEFVGVSRKTVVHHAPERVKRSRIRTIRDAVDDMSAANAVDFLLCILEELHADIDRSEVLPLIEHGFTAAQARVLAHLMKRQGVTCTKTAIYEICCVGKSDDERPEIKIVDVYVSHIRKRLPEGSRIDTIWGVGYRFERELGAVMPWEREP